MVWPTLMYVELRNKLALLAFCETNPDFTGWFPSQRDSNVELWCVIFVNTKKLLIKQPGCLWFKTLLTWWRHRMETVSALLNLCEGNPPVTGRFPSQRPVTRSFDDFFDVRQNKRLSKRSRCWWFETPWRLLWRHRSKWHHFDESRLRCIDDYSYFLYQKYHSFSTIKWITQFYLYT